MTLRTVEVYNHYIDDDEEVTNTETIDIIDRDKWDPDADDFEDGDGDYDSYVERKLFEITGTGRSGDAYYNVESIDGLKPVLSAEWWG